MLQTKPDWLKPLFPWEQKAVTVNGRTMAYIDEGDPEAAFRDADGEGKTMATVFEFGVGDRYRIAPAAYVQHAV